VIGMLVGTEAGRLCDPFIAGAVVAGTVVAGATVEAGAVVGGMWQRY
jgi:ABC-type transporter Mla maintaining outer membrane lipid asymmetry permease subunit MlaE